jgi:hypothetical protein
VKPDLITEELGAGVTLRAVSAAGRAVLLGFPLPTVADELLPELLVVEHEPEIPADLAVWRVVR